MAAQVLGGREQVKVAVVQASSVFMNKKGCLEKACDKIIEAGKEGAELVVPHAQVTGLHHELARRRGGCLRRRRRLIRGIRFRWLD